jgi:mRNA interferase YafQ
MLKLERTNKFKKDYKLAQKRGKKLEHFEPILHDLILEKPLHPRFRPHKLTGNYSGYWECHVEPDYLLIYEYQDGVLNLIRLGTHADLFN